MESILARIALFLKAIGGTKLKEWIKAVFGRLRWTTTTYHPPGLTVEVAPDQVYKFPTLAMKLPPELWSSVIRYLPSSDQRTCLSVSRFYHDLSIRFVFSTVQICFIHPGSRWRYNDKLQFISQQESRQLLSHSRELLDRISQDPHFAKIVQRVIVQADRSEVTLERRCLIKALRCLPHLRAFYWFGDSRTLARDVVKSLIKSTKELQELRIPEPLLSYADSLKSLNSLKRLSYNAVEGPLDMRFDRNALNDHEEVDVIGLINTNAAVLRGIFLPGRLAWNLPIPVFSNLTEIGIIRPEKLDNLGQLLHHATNLESLLLVGIDSYDIFPVLLANASAAMPHLTSLKISSTLWKHTAEHFLALSKFLQGRPSLRRLDIIMGGTWSAISTIFPALQPVEVLGLQLGMVGDCDFSHLAPHLPPHLSTARFSFYPDGDPQAYTLSPLIDKLAQLPSLHFLVLDCHTKHIPLGLEELATLMKHLEIIGIQHDLRYISRPNEFSVTLSQWSRRMARLALLEDFGCKDEEWLMRHQSDIVSDTYSYGQPSDLG